MIAGYPFFLATAALAVLAVLLRREYVLRHKPPAGGDARFARLRELFQKAVEVAAGIIAIAAAALLVIGLLPWQDTLASWTTPAPGQAALVIADIILVPTVFWELFCKLGYHHVTTLVTCSLGGTAGMLTFAQMTSLLHHGVKMLPKTGQALVQAFNRIGTGKAARHVHKVLPGPISGGHTIAFAGFAALAFVLFVAFGGWKWAAKMKKAGRASTSRKRNSDRRGLPAGDPRPGRAPVAVGDPRPF